MPQPNMEEAVRKAEQALRVMTWKRMADAPVERAYEGEIRDNGRLVWQGVCVAFAHADGSVGFDGAVTDIFEMCVVHLTQKLAKLGVELAEKQIKE